MQFERTRNTRLNEGLAGGTKASSTPKTPASAPPSWTTSGTAKSACSFELGASQTAMLGTEWTQQRMKDGTLHQPNADGRHHSRHDYRYAQPLRFRAYLLAVCRRQY
ncbi:hypothetical protein M8494_35910 [Serratia ureilytica]